MFDEFWSGGPRPSFAAAGDWGPGGYEGWQPWARRDEEWGRRGGRGRGPWGRHEHEHGPEHEHRHHGRRGPGPWGPWGGPGGPGRGPWGGWGGGPGGPPWGGPGGPDVPYGPGGRFGAPWGGPWERPWGGPGDWLRHFARHFPFGPGFGPGGPGGPGMGPGGPGMGRRMFGRGDLKYALLDLLRERPKHGYEMIKDLEERTGGFYTPSAGAIYPTLQLLEDRGWVTAETVEGKRVYAMTDAGRTALADHEQRGEQHGGPFRGPRFGGRGRGPFGWEMSPELASLGRESMHVAHLMRRAVMASAGDPERLARLRAIVERTRDELNAFVGQAGAEPGPGGAPGPQGGPVEHL